MPASCPRCAAETAIDAAVCPNCGTDLPLSSSTETDTAPRPFTRTPGGGSTPVPSPTRFAPGTLLADRYRVVSLIGRGGMGEVYRVDDIRLGQAVALKFLPELFQQDPERLERLYGEVRVARQVSHPNMCRVHDVGEVGGQTFLSMEYVDGENLASLMRRIGTLPQGKALEVARQLCAGLAAAHARNVLHRDLKPENIMVDGRGQVRITDFGLAGLADSFQGEDVRSGTPAYMSPEQLSGKAVDARSDIYSLGLVLYQLFTGRRAFEGKTLSELVRKHAETPPVPPSVLQPEIDPAIERAILKCLEKDPERRPPSVQAVAALLPGGDLLAAALAAGETPSPEVVAEAGDRGVLTARQGVLALGGALIFGALALRLLPAVSLLELVPFPKPPAALEDRAHSLLQSLGYPPQGADQDRGFLYADDYLASIAAREHAPGRWDVLHSGRPAAIRFWYRTSPRPMLSLLPFSQVRTDTPAPTDAGMQGVELDPEGHLLSFYAVTPQLEPLSFEGRMEPDFHPLIAAAGFDEGGLASVPPRWTPPFFVDARAAWDGSFPSGAKAHLEAAAYRGRPVFFQVTGPWTLPDRQVPEVTSARVQALQLILLFLLVTVTLSAVLLARRNARMGRVDTRGAARLARYALAVVAAIWLLVAHHVTRFDQEMELLMQGAGLTLFLGGVVWLLYAALEPPVRRRSPLRIVGWSRLLAGRFEDPLVGRSVLLGVFWGCLKAFLQCMSRVSARGMGMPPPVPWATDLDALVSPRFAVGDLMAAQITALAVMMGLLLLLVVLQALLRREWAAAVVMVLIMGAQGGLSLGSEALSLGQWLAYVSYTGLSTAIVVYVLLKEGFLAGVVTYLVQFLFITAPLTLDTRAWYAGIGLFYIAVIASMGVYGFWAARGGEPLLGDGLLGD
jgi:serine/threonine-protein kinase